MMPSEYHSVSQRTLLNTFNNWKDRIVKFEISGCKMVWHEDKSGAKMWILCFKIVSKDIDQLRKDLGLKENPNFEPHISALEYAI